MNTNNIFFIFLLSLFVLCACQKEEVPTLETKTFFECHDEQTWDSTKVKNHLIGEWEWQSIKCFWNPESTELHRGLIIHFQEDGKLIVENNGMITQTGTWQIKEGQCSTFALEMNPVIDQAFGGILFCDGYLLFHDSCLDGCDNYFQKK